MEPVRSATQFVSQPKTTWTPRKSFVTPVAGRETKEERDRKQVMINKQSARRDAVDFLSAQKLPFTEQNVFDVAQKFYEWASK